MCVSLNLNKQVRAQQKLKPRIAASPLCATAFTLSCLRQKKRAERGAQLWWGELICSFIYCYGNKTLQVFLWQSINSSSISCLLQCSSLLKTLSTLFYEIILSINLWNSMGLHAPLCEALISVQVHCLSFVYDAGCQSFTQLSGHICVSPGLFAGQCVNLFTLAACLWVSTGLSVSSWCAVALTRLVTGFLAQHESANPPPGCPGIMLVLV